MSHLHKLEADNHHINDISLIYVETVLHAILESSFDGVLVIDHTGIIELSNPAAERIFGFSSSAIIGLRIRNITSFSSHQT